jgi:hypothetical protein
MKTKSLLIIFKIVSNVSAGNIFSASLWKWEKGKMICWYISIG